MRKLDKRNKAYIFVVIVIVIILLILFSLFAFKILKNKKVSYTVNDGTVVYDENKMMLSLENSGTLKKKWNDKYYLVYQDEEYDIGTHAIGYDNLLGTLNLYGTFYEVLEDGSVVLIEEHEELQSTLTPKFYKLADRKYLIVDKEITSTDGALDTTGYLIIEIDKTGNATLANNKVNLKTLSETTIVTSAFEFNIAKELLKFGEEEIDVTKVIGSTNTYTELREEERISSIKGGGGDYIYYYNVVNNESNNTVINNTVYNNSSVVNNSNVVNNNTTNNNTTNNNIQQGGGITTEEMIQLATKTSIVSVTGYVNYIEGIYVIYDPLSEYKNVYVDVIDKAGNLVTTYYLSKDNTNFAITNLNADSEYKLVFKYTYLKESEEGSYLTNDIFDVVNVKTTKPDIDLDITKVTRDKVYYTVKTDKSYVLDSASVSLYIDDTLISTNLVDVINSSSNGGASSAFDLTTNGTYVTLKLENVSYNGQPIDVDVSYKYRNY